jgi:hypothetical protein
LPLNIEWYRKDLQVKGAKKNEIFETRCQSPRKIPLRNYPSFPHWTKVQYPDDFAFATAITESALLLWLGSIAQIDNPRFFRRRAVAVTPPWPIRLPPEIGQTHTEEKDERET